MKPRTLRSRLAFSYSLILVLATILLGSGVSYLTAQRLQNNIGQSLEDLAFTLSDRLDRDMFYRFRDLAAMVVVARDRETIDGLLIEQNWLEELQQSFPFYKWIGFTDVDGNVLVSTGGLLQGLNVSARPWFQGARDDTFFGDVHDALLLERLLPEQEEPWRFVDVAIPVFNSNNEFVGVLGAHLSWEWVREVQELVLNVAAYQGTIEALVLQQDGTVLFGPPNLDGAVVELPPAGDEPSHHLINMQDNQQYLLGKVLSQGYRDYPGLGWQIVVRQQAGQAFAPVRQLQWNIFGWGLVVVAVVFVLSILNARHITTPLQQISNTAKRLRAGDNLAVFPQDVGYAEGQSLVDSLSSLTQQLMAREQELKAAHMDLEQRVEQRTKELSAANLSIQENERRLRLITDNVPALIAYMDNEHRFRFFNRSFLEWYGLRSEHVDGLPVQEVLPEPKVQAVKPFIERALMGERVSFDREETIGDQVRYLHETYTPDVASDGSVPGFYITAIDITARKIAELNLQHQSDHDALTGLLNRYGLRVRLARAVARAMRQNHPLAMFFIDLDHFKEVNDNLGHAAGDELLQMTAQRLLEMVRANDTVARLGGDEFVVVLEDLQNPDEDVAAIAGKIIDTIVRPFELAHGKARVSVSIGIAIDQAVDGNTEALMKRADKAMYKAKEQGRNRFAIAD